MLLATALATLGITFFRVWGYRRKHEELKARDLALRKAQALAQVGRWEFEVVPRRAHWSEVACQLLGVTPGRTDLEEALRKCLLPGDWPRLRRFLDKSLAGDTRSGLEVRVVPSDGVKHWVCLRATLERFPNGKARRLVGTVQDITDRKRIEQNLQHRLALERIVAGISTRFASVPVENLDSAIDASLATLGAWTNVDRAYLIVLSTEGNKVSHVQEWAAVGAKPLDRDLWDVSAKGFSWLLNRLKKGEVVLVHDTARLPDEAIVFREMLEAGHVRSLLNVPVRWGQRLGGVAGFVVLRQSKTWDEQDVTLMQTVAEIFASGLGRREMEGEHKRVLAALAEQLEHLERRVNDRTAELLHANERLFEQIKERENVGEQLTQRIAENRRLTQTLIALQEQDGRALAQELHDEMGQSLTAIKTDAVLIKRRCAGHHSKIRQRAENIIEVSEQVYDRIHELLRRLRPAALDDMGLVAALQALVTSMHLDALGIHCEERYRGELDDVGERLNITLYRLVQEALTNVVKHAQARNVWVELMRKTAQDVGVTLSGETDVVRLSVRDDGLGADFSVKSFGYGLLGLRERVQALGGEFEVDGVPGRGTVVRATVPVHAMLLRDEFRID